MCGVWGVLGVDMKTLPVNVVYHFSNPYLSPYGGDLTRGGLQAYKRVKSSQVKSSQVLPLRLDLT